MKSRTLLCSVLLVLLSFMPLLAGGQQESDGASAVAIEDRPATWIADRHIVGRAFIDDLGVSLPDDQVNNAVAQKIKELTGITMEWEYTAASSDREMMIVCMATGDLGDVFTYYLNDASRPEMPVVLKGAREGMLHDIAPFLKNTKVYSKYFEKDFLPNDSYKNILFRPEFNGATYMVHMAIPRYLGSSDRNYRGGMFIQKSIADSLGVDPADIKTTDDLYGLLKKIKAGNFTDNNGRPVYPIGPSIWGGRMSEYIFADKVISSNNNFAMINGKIVHEAETDYVIDQIKYVRKLIAEGLIHPETFTMENTRADEGCRSNSFAIIADIHNYMDIFQKNEYLPISPLNEPNGEVVFEKSGKSGYCGWSIPSTTENPEDIVKFADFLASQEGKLLWMYGIEGEHYDMVDGKPMVKQKMFDLKDEDRTAFYNENVYAGGGGSHWGWGLGNTDLAFADDFGEAEYGVNTDPSRFELPNSLYEYGYEDRGVKRNIVYREGFSAKAYLQDVDNSEELKTLLESYDDIRIQAFFVNTEAEAEKIIEKYRAQLKNAGLDNFESHLMDLYKDDPKSVYFREK